MVLSDDVQLPEGLQQGHQLITLFINHPAAPSYH